MSAEPETIQAPAETKRELPALGVHDGWDDTDYRRAPGINKHSLDLIDRSPATYWFERHNPRPATPALVTGSALHCLVLEPHLFPERYVRAPSNAPRRPSDRQRYAKKPSAETLAAIAFWDEFEAENGDKILLSAEGDPDKGAWGMSDWDRIHAMAASVAANPIASALLDGARTELTMFWRDEHGRGEDPTWRLCKGRADFYSEAHGLLGDLKTANDASFSGFCRAINDHRYDVQDAWYFDGARQSGLPVSGFVFIVVEKDPPFLTACYTLPQEWRSMGRMKYRRNLETYHECLRTGEWPGYETLRDLQVPSYAKFLPIR